MIFDLCCRASLSIGMEEGHSLTCRPQSFRKATMVAEIYGTLVYSRAILARDRAPTLLTASVYVFFFYVILTNSFILSEAGVLQASFQ